MPPARGAASGPGSEGQVSSLKIAARRHGDPGSGAIARASGAPYDRVGRIRTALKRRCIRTSAIGPDRPAHGPGKPVCSTLTRTKREVSSADPGSEDDALILMSTPASRRSLFRASIVLLVGWTMSMSRLGSPGSRTARATSCRCASSSTFSCSLLDARRQRDGAVDDRLGPLGGVDDVPGRLIQDGCGRQPPSGCGFVR